MSPCSAQLITELANSSRAGNSQGQATGHWLQIVESVYLFITLWLASLAVDEYVTWMKQFTGMARN